MTSAVCNILYIAGYTFDVNNNVYVSPLDIEQGRQNTYVARSRVQKKESLKRMALTTIYKLIIYALILWLVPYSLYMAIRDKNVYEFGRSWFQILIAMQHYYAASYFSDNHFYENIMCNEKLKRYMSNAVPCILLLSISLGVLNVTLLNIGFRYNGYDELYNNAQYIGKVLISLLIFFDSFYSYITFTINSCVFVINMVHHKITVSNYSEALGNYIKNSMNVVRKINIVATEFSQMKCMFDKTVQLLTPFFSVLNFVGFITIYFYLDAVQNQDLSVSEYINVILFIIVEYVYIQSIQAVNQNISNIEDVITSNSMITTFFGNKRFNRTMPLIDSHLYEHGYMSSPNLNSKESDIVDLNIRRHDESSFTHPDTPYSNAVNSNAVCSNNLCPVPGINTIASESLVDGQLGDDRMDMNLMTKKLPQSLALAHVDAIPMSTLNLLPQDQYNQSRDPSSEYYKQRDNSDQQMNHLIPESYLNANINVMKQVMIASISTEQMLDWLVLSNIVSVRWKTFTVFGVEFTDTTLISKLFGAGVGVLMTAQLGFILKWW